MKICMGTPVLTSMWFKGVTTFPSLAVLITTSKLLVSPFLTKLIVKMFKGVSLVPWGKLSLVKLSISADS